MDAAEQHWRRIVLYGRNTATYKFALGRALLELGSEGRDFVPLDELAWPFQRYFLQHLGEVSRQTRASSSRYLLVGKAHLDGRVNEDEMHAATLMYGLRYVIDAFPNLDGPGAEPVQFYAVDRRHGRRGIQLTDDLLSLAASERSRDLDTETETRWQLVERAWESQLDDDLLLTVSYEAYGESLVPTLLGERRRWRAPVRPALNGYQKGYCFYCWRPISALPDGDDGSHVDHLFPFVLSIRGVPLDLDSVWNLVLACTACNLSKGAALPAARYVRQLHDRNEWLIGSNHPLRETVIAATGTTVSDRYSFLNEVAGLARNRTSRGWETPAAGPSPFPSMGTP